MNARAPCSTSVVSCIGALVLAGCHRITADMADQPRRGAETSSAFFADSQSARPRVADSVVHSQGESALISSGRAGLVQAPDIGPSRVDASLAPRGRDRYLIYCLPCHGVQGDGDGEVVRRGFPQPQPFTAAVLRNAPDEQLHAAIRRGSGAMAAFADRVSTEDAWAIVAYLRELQRERVPQGELAPHRGVARAPQ